jgi:hypothetical protein
VKDHIQKALASEDSGEWVTLVGALLQQDLDQKAQATDWPALLEQAKACNPEPLHAAMLKTGWTPARWPQEVQDWLKMVHQLSRKGGDPGNPDRPAAAAWMHYRAQFSYEPLRLLFKRIKKDQRSMAADWFGPIDRRGRPKSLTRIKASTRNKQQGRILTDGVTPQDLAIEALSRLLNLSPDATRERLFHHKRDRSTPHKK